MRFRIVKLQLMYNGQSPASFRIRKNIVVSFMSRLTLVFLVIRPSFELLLEEDPEAGKNSVMTSVIFL